MSSLENLFKRCKVSDKEKESMFTSKELVELSGISQTNITKLFQKVHLKYPFLYLGGVVNPDIKKSRHYFNYYTCELVEIYLKNNPIRQDNKEINTLGITDEVLEEKGLDRSCGLEQLFNWFDEIRRCYKKHKNIKESAEQIAFNPKLVIDDKNTKDIQEGLEEEISEALKIMQIAKMIKTLKI